MKRLECGVGYEDDSTQVSDSDESSEEDMSMTPWQQMTQTFGMGKAAAARSGQRRRSSVSSVSQIDRSSLKQRKPSITAPKSLKQIITDYFLRGNKKVQPSSTSEMALAEHIRLMDAKLSSIRSALCKNGGFGPLSSTSSAHDAPNSVKVVYERAPNGVRAYGTVIECLDDGGYAVVTEDEQGISVQAVPEGKVDFLPSARELEQQLSDLERSQRVLFAGQKVHVSLYPGSRFSGPGLITLERDPGSRFHVLLANRIRLVNVPADKITPVCEKKKVAVTITEDQFLVCSNKVKVYIGDQIYVKCATGDDGDLDGSVEEEKLGLLNGVYSNRTAAVDFADGSTGYEVPPHLIFKRKRLHVPVDQDVRSLKNAVLMQASAAANGSAGGNALVLEEGYQVKADHPSKASVESCVVIKTHRSTACDLRFSDGTIAFEVFPSQMIIDSVGMKPKTAAMKERFKRAHPPPEYAVGDYVLAWSSRFGRYCSAKINAKASQDRSTTDSESLTSPTENSTIETTLYTLVFDYGEKKADVPADKITTLDDTKALTHTQRLTNFSIDTMGFELSPVIFFAGEAVMARVHGSARYYNGSVESVNEKERHCVVCFDSSERDTDVPFSAIFSVDSRSSFSARTTAGSTMQFSGGGNSSSSEATSRSRFLLRHRNTDETTDSEVLASPRRHSGSGSVRNILKLVAENFLRSSRLKPNPEARRGSHVITEIGARRLRLPDQK
ncbi:hypothetical protein PHYBOEH_004054 [Phytophthora boehmeriae]|uniref:Uncharacterized protein n=1 Tax=Phytophthora boehmeriae TaxID=109152 RepID=A0A8T1X9W2_9STRA|nr:hypothetical protein PHYBOEH_004054 [Phytophthora boehmeriae]